MSIAEERLRTPPPGSRVATALDFGIDLTLLIERLRKTPEERVRGLRCKDYLVIIYLTQDVSRQLVLYRSIGLEPHHNFFVSNQFLQRNHM